MVDKRRQRDEEGEKSPRVSRFLVRRIASFWIDWLIIGFLAYGIVYLLNYYWYTVSVDWFGTLTLPPWGWPIAVVGTLEIALLCRAFGHSFGMRVLGLMTVTGDRDRPSMKERLRYYGAMHVAIVPAGVGVWLSPRSPWHERLSGIHLIPIPRRDEWSDPPPPWYGTVWGITAFVLFAMTVTLSWHITDVSLKNLIGEADKAARIWKGLFNPNFDALVADYPAPINDSILGALVETLFMALLATIFGAVIAFPLSFLGARNVMRGTKIRMGVFWIIRGFFNVFRSIESILWAMIFAIWVGWGPYAGTLALMLHTIAALGKLYSEQAEHIDPGPVEAIYSAGGGRIQTIRHAVIPQVIPPYLAFTLYRWEINVRMATVISLVGGGGIGRLLFYFKRELDWARVGAIVIAIAVVVWVLDYVSGRVRERIV